MNNIFCGSFINLYNKYIFWLEIHHLMCMVYYKIHSIYISKAIDMFCNATINLLWIYNMYEACNIIILLCNIVYNNNNYDINLYFPKSTRDQ